MGYGEDIRRILNINTEHIINKNSSYSQHPPPFLTVPLRMCTRPFVQPGLGPAPVFRNYMPVTRFVLAADRGPQSAKLQIHSSRPEFNDWNTQFIVPIYLFIDDYVTVIIGCSKIVATIFLCNQIIDRESADGPSFSSTPLDWTKAWSVADRKEHCPEHHY